MHFAVGLFFVVELLFVGGQILEGCPDAISVTADQWSPKADVTWTEPVLVSDDYILTYQSHAPGPIPVGDHQVLYRYSQIVGQEESICTFQLQVLQGDTEPPVVSNCPSDFEREFEYGTGNVRATWTVPTATDSSGSVRVENNYEPGQEFYVHHFKRIEIMYTFIDASENKAYCIFNIYFVPVDTIPPLVTYCPTPTTITVPLGQTRVRAGIEVPGVNEESKKLYWSTDSELPDVYELGTTTITHMFSDYAGLVATCDVSLTVNQRDLTPPQVTYCPRSVTVGVSPGSSGSMEIVTWDDPEAVDDSNTVFTSSSHTSGERYPVGPPFVIEYIFRDPSGNEAFCDIIVRFVEDGEVPRIFSCPEEVTWMTGPDETSSWVSWKEPFALDQTMTDIVHQSHYPHDEFKTGKTVVQYVFEDSVGNQAVCQFDVHVMNSSGQGQVPEVGPMSDIIIVAIVCVAVAIISILVIIGVTIYCVTTSGTSPDNTKPNTTVATVISQPTVSYDDGGYLRAIQRQPKLPIAPSPPAAGNDPGGHDGHDYMEMTKAFPTSQ